MCFISSTCYEIRVLMMILLQVGAGISTSAGIPDFRSPDTGLYANLAKLDLPFAEAVFDISYFRSNPLPFYTLAHELYPGKYRPTVSHSFVRLLSDKGLLLKLFTQNIDCLDRKAGVPDNQIIEAHGSFACQHCIECKSPFPDDLMKQAVAKAEVPHCLTPQCNGLVKPDIVFFGEALPQNFHENRSLPSVADLCIVMGTSLSVQPFASLPSLCPEGVPRVLINLERVGGLGSRSDDVLILGECDLGVRKLAAALGWEEELDRLWNETNPEMQDHEQDQDVRLMTKEETLNDQIASLSEEVDKSLQISSSFESEVRGQLYKNGQTAVESLLNQSKSSRHGQMCSEGKDQEVRGAASNLTSRTAGETQIPLEDVSIMQASNPTDTDVPITKQPSTSILESKTSIGSSNTQSDT